MSNSERRDESTRKSDPLDKLVRELDNLPSVPLTTKIQDWFRQKDAKERQFGPYNSLKDRYLHELGRCLGHGMLGLGWGFVTSYYGDKVGFAKEDILEIGLSGPVSLLLHAGVSTMLYHVARSNMSNNTTPHKKQLFYDVFGFAGVTAGYVFGSILKS